ncbi:MAG: hypothetical protein Q9M50_11125 [Methylococcales bacterium]|nr:hypothetical protein [Methylococcales bacterium]
MQAYERIINLAKVRDLKDIFLEDIRNNRPLLKSQRIAAYDITQCAFSGNYFSNKSEVEFAHIESVVTQPLNALNIDNGVIIRCSIHRELTKQGMYNFCIQKNYFTNWAD